MTTTGDEEDEEEVEGSVAGKARNEVTSDAFKD